MSTYTEARKNYYEDNADLIKAKRRKVYKENILKEREQALSRHYSNQKRNNKTSLTYYYKHSSELNKKRRS